jgi:hypothetical protein
MKIALIAALAASVSLASCSTTADPQEAAAATYDNICRIAPPAYLAFMSYAAVKPVKQSVKDKVQKAQIIVTELCTDRPTDLVGGLTTLANAYAKMLDYRDDA